MAKVSLRNYSREIETMIDRGQLDEAIAHCQHILKTFPKHLETYRLLGKAYLEYKRFDDAVDIFSRVLAAEPNDFVANVGMSIIRDEQNKLDDALWHMERAFEKQPSNPAIQGELQRLYARRDGIQPPRIRMTRGALAHMYVQGELYPQAISEIKGVLKEDPGRSDMSVLLARAYFKSGQKNEAADAANSVLRRYPYCLDANRVLVEVLGAERAENAQVYRQRVVELDPYSSQVAGSIFDVSEVGDNAVAIERFEWSGQSAAMPADWGAAKALPPESGFGTAPQAEPDWLKMGLTDSPQPVSFTPTTAPPSSASVSPLDFTPASTPVPTEPRVPKTVPTEDNIPDFLREAGWGETTGTFDESKSSFPQEPAAAASETAPLEQGELPDWVKAMMPKEAVQPAEPAQPAEEEELPDWIQNIGAGALASGAWKSSEDQPDWLKSAEESAPVPASEQPDWKKGIEPPAEPAPSSEQPDWLKGLEQPAEPVASSEQPEWSKGLEQPAASDASLDWLKDINQPQAAPAEDLDWLKGLEQPTEVSAKEPDWLKSFGQPQPSQSAAADELPDWMKSFGEPEAQTAAPGEEPGWLKAVSSEPEVTPSAEPVEQPEWLRQFGSLPEEPSAAPASVEGELDILKEIAESPAETPLPAASAVEMGSLGTSEQEQEDSFAWLEALAAKQGATEGLLTKPEERLQEEPEWIRQAKGLTTPPAVEQPPAEPVTPIPPAQPEPIAEQPPVQPIPVEPAPVPGMDELGKSEQERDDSFAWLEALAAKQGATEGLLTKPEERLEEEPEWVKQAKGVTTEPALEQPPVEPEPVMPIAGQPPVPPIPADAAPIPSMDELGKSEQERADSFAWLEALAAKQGATEGLLTKPEERLEEEPEWVKQAKVAPQTPVEEPSALLESIQPKEPVASVGDETTAWLRGLEREEPESAGDETMMWFKKLEESEAAAPVTSQPQPADDLPSWLRDLEEEKPGEEPVSASDETMMWLKSLETPEPTEPAPPTEQALARLKGIEEEEKARAVESTVPEGEAVYEFDRLNPIEEPAAPPEESLPDWLKGVDEESRRPGTGPLSELPAWMRDETGELLAEPTKIEPTRATDWQPVEERQPEPPTPEPMIEESPTMETAVSQPVIEELPKPKPAPRKKEPKPETYKEPVTAIRGTGMLGASSEPILGLARNELTRSNIPGALEVYGKLIKKGRYLDEIIFDLREASYRYPVEVSIWQALGDAYMRANRLQDALDAYTKAEELLR